MDRETTRAEAAINACGPEATIEWLRSEGERLYDRESFEAGDRFYDAAAQMSRLYGGPESPENGSQPT